MATYAVNGDILSDIADAIRQKRDIADAIPVADMAMQIGLIDGGGISYGASIDVVKGVISGQYLVGESEKIGTIRIAIYMIDDAPAIGENCTLYGVVAVKDTTLEAYRGFGINSSNAWASASIVNSRRSSGKIQFVTPTGLPFKSDASYTIVLFGDPK